MSDPGSAAPFHLLTFTMLYPHAAAPTQGVFVENRLRHLLASGAARATVLAPVPWFPFRAERFGRWAVAARAPAEETRHGIRVLHPRFAAIPRLGMTLAPFLLYHAMRPVLRRLRAAGARFDAIDAHYLYPDGVAAVRLARAAGLPVVLTARGSDVTQIAATYPGPRRRILEAARAADALITVSAALRDDLIGLGAPAEKIVVLRNGVDTSLFRPPSDTAARAAARAALGVSGPTLLSVGHLIPRKGHEKIVAALTDLPDHTLLIAGGGEGEAALRAEIARRGLSARVRLLGIVPHAELPALYAAADALVLASSREGWANVLLEAMACGTPVIASNIPGNPEVVRAPEAGLILDANTPEGIVRAVRRLAAAPPDRAATRAYAERFGWEETTAGQVALFRRVIAARRAAG
jgi:glycosyltransferase involved in cell wall biosynthesis